MADEGAGRIFNIQRFCISDGPGIRTTVFFQGCPLHCPWCHNPESRPFAPRVSFQASACLACGLCRKMEPGENCRREPEKRCSGCGLCVRECPGGALTLLGRSASVDEIMQTVLRDRFYYEQTGGGLTLSGGEPTAQPDFALALLAAAKELGIHTAMETSGAVPTEIFARFIGKCDLYLFDVKASKKQYAELTGGNPKHIFSNLRALSDAGGRIVLRVPMVQGKNVDAELAQLLEKLAHLPNVEAVELLTFHDMGRGKAAMIGEPEPDWNTMSSDIPPDMARHFAAIPKLRCKSTNFLYHDK